MCAIAGLICSKQQCRGEEHEEIIRKLCRVQTHRGPDDEGIISIDNVCLGSNRLSIIDLTKAGRMPMADIHQQWWITYNGETYNFQEIREELIRCGYVFRSKTDTEVVLYAFMQWGEKCLERFVGMFALAVYDRKNESIILARDRFGEKPLYYTCQNGHILFASEMKALMEVCDDPRPNEQRLAEWSLFRNVDFGPSDTLVNGLFSLPPGHFMSICQGKLNPARCYYSPESQVDINLYERFKKQPFKSSSKEIETLLSRSVRERLVSDVPLGTLCSGGIDSSLITAISVRHLKDVAAFNISVSGYSRIDESRYAKQVTDALGIDLFIYNMEAADFLRNLPRAIYHSDFPLTHPNSIAFLLVSDFARKHGIKVLLSGEAADELFGGYMQRYRRYREFLWLQRVLSHLPNKLCKIIALFGYACDRVPITSFSEYKGLLAHTTAFLDRFAREDLRLRCTEAYRFIHDGVERAVLGAILADLTNFLAPLLRRLDRMSMAASLECRVPYLDHQLVKTVVNLPLTYRLHGTTDKWLLKKIALKYLPHNIVYRKKVGFPLPLMDYIKPLAHEDLFHDGFCLNYLNMHYMGFMEAISKWRENVNGFFNLLALEIWGRLFFMHQSIEDITEQVTRLSHNKIPSLKHTSPKRIMR